jgi:hypothetical protein
MMVLYSVSDKFLYFKIVKCLLLVLEVVGKH